MPVDVPELFASSKALISTLAWVSGPERNSFEAPLEIDGVALAGARLRGTVYTSAPQRAVMLQLECHGASNKIGPLDRIDWNPIHTHNNQGKGPPDLRFVRQAGSHHHQFDLNWLPVEQRMRANNLPIAVPMEPNLASVEDLFRFAEEHFKIKGLSRQQLPEWQDDLFRSAT